MRASVSRRATAVFTAVCAPILGLSIVHCRSIESSTPLAPRERAPVVRHLEPVVEAPSIPAPPPRAKHVDPFAVAGDQGRDVAIYPPLEAAHAPAVVMLHGMCSRPEWTCDFWSEGARASSWLVCPSGNASCGDAPDWGGPIPERVRSVEASLRAVDREIGDDIDHAAGDVLVGYSRGGFLARDVLYASERKYRGVVFLGAAVSPDVERLRAAGIRRAVFACGDYDGAKPTMKRAAATLSDKGIPSRFVSLGPIPHALPQNLADVLAREIAWIREGSAT